MKAYQILALPSWAESEYYNIAATTGGTETPSEEHTRLMLQTLLADRFQVRTRREIKEMSIYALMVGKNGPKLKPPVEDSKGSVDLMAGKLSATRSSMGRLAELLSARLDRPVFDKTDIEGAFAFEITANEMGFMPQALLPPDERIPSIFTVLEEQTGLRLVSEKGPVELLTVERVEHPSQN